MATLEDVRAICSRFPGASEGDGRFGFGIMVKGRSRGFCWSWMERIHPKKAKVANLGVLAVRTPNIQAKQMLLESGDPGLFDEPHYAGYPAILVRLEEVDSGRLEDLLVEAWLTLAPPGSQPLPPEA